jgi:uncharacterized tellurite resistance protein B-like protein
MTTDFLNTRPKRKSLWSRLRQRVRRMFSFGKGDIRKLGKDLRQLATGQPADDLPEGFYRPVDLNVLNGRMRIGREAEGDTWHSVLIVEVCGTIRAPIDGYAVSLKISLSDVTDSDSEPLSVLSRPKHGPLNTSSGFVFVRDMGKLCQRTTVLEDWTTVAQLSPQQFVLPRTGHRKLHCNLSLVGSEGGDVLAGTGCETDFESVETGYLDVGDNIQRAKTLAVGLAFSIGAAGGQLLDPEVNVICAWVTTNFGAPDASDGARLELERAVQKTAAFFRKGGRLNVQEVCREIVEIAPLVGRLDILELCLRVIGAKGQVTAMELMLMKDVASWLGIERARLRTMVEKILPVEMHQTQDAEMVLGVTNDMSMDEKRKQLAREYAKWSARVISTDPTIRRQADQMIHLIADARVQYVGSKASQ